VRNQEAHHAKHVTGIRARAQSEGRPSKGRGLCPTEEVNFFYMPSGTETDEIWRVTTASGKPEQVLRLKPGHTLRESLFVGLEEADF